MGSNQGFVDFNTLARGLSQAKLVPYGGAGKDSAIGRILNSLGYVGDFVQGVASAPQGVPGVVGGLGALADRYNVRQFNKTMAAQMAEEQARARQLFELEQTEKAKARGDRAAVGFQAGLKGYQGYADLPDASTLANIQNLAYQQDPEGMRALLEQGQVNPVQGGTVPQYVVESALKQSQDVNKSDATMRNIAQFMAEQFGKNVAVTPDGTVTDASGMSDDPGVKAFQAGAKQNQIVMPGQAFQYPVVDYQEGFKFRQNEQTNARGVASNEETARHNKASEAAAMKNANANMIRAQKYQPGGGGSGNPYTIPNAQQNFVEGQIKAIDSQLKSMGIMDSSGKIKTPDMSKYSSTSKWFDGKIYKSPAEMAKMDQVLALIQQRDQLQSVIYGGPPTQSKAAFGGNSKQKVEQAGSNAAEAYKRYRQGY